jgi:hypothetical protein
LLVDEDLVTNGQMLRTFVRGTHGPAHDSVDGRRLAALSPGPGHRLSEPQLRRHGRSGSDES